jgi:hypothetical protein
MPDEYLHRASSRVPYFSSDGETYLAQTPLRDLQKTAEARVLSEEDFAFWQTYGYVVVKQAIPAPAPGRLLDFAWDFQGSTRPARKPGTRSETARTWTVTCTSTGSWRPTTTSSCGTAARRSGSTTPSSTYGTAKSCG